MTWTKKYYLLILFSVAWYPILAQTGNNENSIAGLGHKEGLEVSGSDSSGRYAAFTVRNIVIDGNKKTRNQIILRELPFKPGDKYALRELVKKFEHARRQLMNTTLFHNVVVALKGFEGNNVDILVEVTERWYIFPIPYLKPVDNFNTWIGVHNMRLDRVNYGLKFIYKNATGRNDNLNVRVTNGYTKEMFFNYDRLYFDKSMKWGINMQFSLGKNHEMNYNTINDKPVPFKDNDNFIRSYVKGNIELTYRPAIKTRHRFGFGYTVENLQDTVATLNPIYFNSGQSRVHFPELYYTMTYFDVDYIPYPLKGFVGEFSIRKKGFNKELNVWEFSAKASESWRILNDTYFNLRTVGILKVPFNQPYYNKRLLGSEAMFLQGYEYYVVDGVALGYMKATLTRELFKVNLPVNPARNRNINFIPFRFYGKIYGNAGYAYNPNPGENFLTNRMLYSGGIGLDIITLYDLTLKLEWSFNRLGENGLYLHQNTYF